MGLLDNLMGNPQTQQQLQDFANRYQQGPPHEGYSDQEVMQTYQQVAPQLPQQDYVAAAEQAFDRMSPQERQQFGQFVEQQAQNQGTAVPGFGQGVSPQMYQNSSYLAQQTAQLHQQQPGLLGQLLGGGISGSGGGGAIGSPVAKAALAGIAAMAVSRALGGNTSAGGVVGNLLGNQL